MTITKVAAIGVVKRQGVVREADVLTLRRAFYEDGRISQEEAEALLDLDAACRSKVPVWTDFLVEAVTDYVVHQAAPEGYVTHENATWLIAEISKDGRAESGTELELLVNVLDKARWSPASLVSFAMEKIKHAVISGEGPLRAGMGLLPGEITEGEVDLLRRILYAFGGEGNVAITKAEAEILFDINDATASAPANPAFADLFAKAIANVLMASSGYAVPTRDEALASEAWLDRRGDLSPGAMLRSIVSSGLGGLMGSYREQSSEERALARLERQRIEIITNETITEGEATWLADRLGRDGKLTPNEEALIAFIERESPNIHPILAERIGKLARAA